MNHFLYIILLMAVAPFSVFFCVKLGRLGYLRANEFFAKQQTTKTKDGNL